MSIWAELQCFDATGHSKEHRCHLQHSQGLRPAEQRGTEFQKVSSPQQGAKSPTNEGLQKKAIILVMNVVILLQS